MEEIRRSPCLYFHPMLDQTLTIQSNTIKGMLQGSNAERDANKLKLIVEHLQKVVKEKQKELDSQ